MSALQIERILSLQKELEAALQRAEFAESVINSFFTGNVPNGASINHVILAKYGRMRLESLKKTPALLQQNN